MIRWMCSVKSTDNFRYSELRSDFVVDTFHSDFGQRSFSVGDLKAWNELSITRQLTHYGCTENISVMGTCTLVLAFPMLRCIFKNYYYYIYVYLRKVHRHPNMVAISLTVTLFIACCTRASTKQTI